MRQVQKTIAIGVLSWITVTYLSHQASGEFQKTAYESLFQKGEACWQSGDFRNAIQAYEQALTLAGNQKNKRGRLDCLMNLGVLRWNIGQMKESAACHAEAKLASREMRLAEELSACTKRLQIYDLYEAGKAAVAARRYQLSIAKFESAIALAKDLGRPEFEVKCLRQLSLSYFDQEKMTEFLQLNEKALGIARRLKHKGEEAKCFNNIGLYYFRKNSYAKALAFFHDALLTFEETICDEGDKANCLNNIALIHVRLGNYEKAFRYLQEAFVIDTKINDSESLIIDLRNMAMVLRNKGEQIQSKDDIKESLRYYLQCLTRV